MATRTTSLIPTGTWAVDVAHSSVEFGIKHGHRHRPRKFTEFEGTLGVGQDLASSSATSAHLDGCPSGWVEALACDPFDVSRILPERLEWIEQEFKPTQPAIGGAGRRPSELRWPARREGLSRRAAAGAARSLGVTHACGPHSRRKPSNSRR
jgi:hypothetical protein